MRHDRYKLPTNDEDRADRALASGDIAEAEAYLDSLANRNPDPDTYHHLSLKKAALPLYELIHGIDDPEVYTDTDDIYATIGKLLTQELDSFSHNYHKEVGRISELVFFGLHFRKLITGQTDEVLLPAPADHDKRGIDFYRQKVNGRKTSGGTAYQVKTHATDAQRDQYASSKVILASMRDIDPHASDPHHPDSLANTLLRELGMPHTDQQGRIRQVTDADSQKLDQAVQWIDTITELKQGRPKNIKTQRALSRTSFTGLGQQRAA